ncbi:SAM-dependent methyltransferase [Beijerinckiaceae bacterium]|nr:SAM-dependent methyltransferase [Beijerinckiaceae bacterium]
MEKLLHVFFAELIKTGSLEIETADGRKFGVGDGSGKKLALRFNDKAVFTQLLRDPELRFGELYMDGRIDVTQGTIFDILTLAAVNMAAPQSPLWVRAFQKTRSTFRHLRHPNDLLRAKRNVAHHYDLDTNLYRLFLDQDLQYSCAYFERDSQNLEVAQLAKKRHIAAKLLVEPGHTILDIGSGFGGLAIYLAQFCNASLTGLTLSSAQLKVAQVRAGQLGLTSAIDFRLLDYRQLDGRFDRIVSVGMFEHVGVAHYESYFRKIADLLEGDGVALVHTIGRADGPAATNPWVAKYIFPGGYMPALSEIMPAIERTGLFVTDIEILRLHYADTVKTWRERFLDHRAAVQALHDERFCRMWELYLAGSECAFRYEGLVVFQIQLAKKLHTVPLTRDYINHNEALLRELDTAPAFLRVAGQ